MSVNLKNLHSFRIPAKARELVKLNESNSLGALQGIEKYLVLAGGTNTVFVEGYYDGTVVVPEFYGVSINESESDFKLRVGASENWHQLVTHCVEQGINGLENLALIPGTVGAAPVQNIGAYGVEVGRYIESVEAIDLTLNQYVRLDNAACQFAYRNSEFKRQINRFLITHVNFRMPKQWQAELSYGPLQALHASVSVGAKTVYDKVIEVRQQKLPMPEDLPNAGSFFKNPEITLGELNSLQRQYPDIPAYPTRNGAKVAAGWMIDQLGLKGFRQGDVAVHDKQALVLVNLGNATGEQLLAVCQYIRQRVYTHFNVWLEPEVRLVGRDGLIELQQPECSSIG